MRNFIDETLKRRHNFRSWLSHRFPPQWNNHYALNYLMSRIVGGRTCDPKLKSIIRCNRKMLRRDFFRFPSMAKNRFCPRSREAQSTTMQWSVLCLWPPFRATSFFNRNRPCAKLWRSHVMCSPSPAAHASSTSTSAANSPSRAVLTATSIKITFSTAATTSFTKTSARSTSWWIRVYHSTKSTMEHAKLRALKSQGQGKLLVNHKSHGR